MYNSILCYHHSVPPTCFSHSYGHPQGCALQMMDILMKLSILHLCIGL